MDERVIALWGHVYFHVYANARVAQTQWEAYDVKHEGVRFFSAEGIELMVHFDDEPTEKIWFSFLGKAIKTINVGKFSLHLPREHLLSTSQKYSAREFVEQEIRKRLLSLLDSQSANLLGIKKTDFAGLIDVAERFGFG